MAIKSLESLNNAESCADDGFLKEHVAEKDHAAIKLKLSETHHLLITKVLIDAEISDA